LKLLFSVSYLLLTYEFRVFTLDITTFFTLMVVCRPSKYYRNLKEYSHTGLCHLIEISITRVSYLKLK